MASTLGQIQTRLTNKIGDGTSINPTLAQITDAINQTVQFYQGEKFWWNESVAPITLIPGNKYLPNIPSNFKQVIEPNALVVEVSQVKYTLFHVTAQEYDSIDVGGTGIPYYYCYRDGDTDTAGGFQLYPYPDQDYTLRLYYRIFYPLLVEPDDTNPMLQYADTMVEYKSLANLLRDYRSSVAGRADQYDGGKDEQFEGGLAGSMRRMFLDETYNRTATGRLVTENIVDDYYNNY